jgi:hypothetical protein
MDTETPDILRGMHNIRVVSSISSMASWSYYLQKHRHWLMTKRNTGDRRTASCQTEHYVCTVRNGVGYNGSYIEGSPIKGQEGSEVE